MYSGGEEILLGNERALLGGKLQSDFVGYG
jgi:hypothetical protein